jgi:DNA-binding response OmpR family regulator
MLTAATCVLSEPGRGGERAPILIVEDDRALRHIMRDVLEEEGYLAETAPDGQPAVAQAGERSPTLVVLDMTLPELNGDGVASRLREQYRNPPPILLVTADGDAAGKARQVGAFAYLSKPLELEEFVSAIQQGLPAVVSQDRVSARKVETGADRTDEPSGGLNDRAGALGRWTCSGGRHSTRHRSAMRLPGA